MDSQLTWKEHVEVKVRKAHNLLWAYIIACGMGWGLGPKVVHWLYVAIVRPTISFASFVWWPGCKTVSTKNKLSKVQRLACLGITGALRTTPTGAMEALVSLLPLDLVIQGRRGQRNTASGAWGVGLTFTPNEDIVAYWLDVRSRTPFLI
jgi:hypothetical protein